MVAGLAPPQPASAALIWSAVGRSLACLPSGGLPAPLKRRFYHFVICYLSEITLRANYPVGGWRLRLPLLRRRLLHFRLCVGGGGGCLGLAGTQPTAGTAGRSGTTAEVLRMYSGNRLAICRNCGRSAKDLPEELRRSNSCIGLFRRCLRKHLAASPASAKLGDMLQFRDCLLSSTSPLSPSAMAPYLGDLFSVCLRGLLGKSVFCLGDLHSARSPPLCPLVIGDSVWATFGVSLALG